MTRLAGDGRRRSRATRSSAAPPAGDEPLVPLASIRLLGRHLIADVLAASAVASLAGVDAGGDDARRSKGSPASSTRWSRWREIGGVRFVNDSKATNIEAARRAIESFDDGVVVILGGRFKGGDFGDLREPLGRARRDGGGDRRSRGR